MLFYVMFNNLYAENVSFFGIYFVFSQNKSVRLCIALYIIRCRLNSSWDGTYI